MLTCSLGKPAEGSGHYEAVNDGQTRMGCWLEKPAAMKAVTRNLDQAYQMPNADEEFQAPIFAFGGCSGS